MRVPECFLAMLHGMNHSIGHREMTMESGLTLQSSHNPGRERARLSHLAVTSHPAQAV